MSYQESAATAKGPRHTGLLVLGMAVLILGVGAGVALYVASGSQYDDAVKALQRAPVGCDTRFNFTETGTFIFYVETKGEVGDLRGDCENTGDKYDSTGDPPPDVTLELVDRDDDPVDLDTNTSASYDTDDYVGSAVNEITIDKPTEYKLSVVSDDDNFAIAVGRNPKEDADSLRTIAIIVGAVGLVLGLLFIVLGLRRKTAVAAPTPFSPGGYTPNFTGPAPTGPPFGQAGASPPPPTGGFSPPPPPAGPFSPQPPPQPDPGSPAGPFSPEPGSPPPGSPPPPPPWG